VAKQQEIFVHRGEKLYCSYPPLFTYLSSLFYPLLGDRVTSLLPLLSFFLSVVVLSGTLRLLLRDRPTYYVLLFGFLLASPVFPYAICFWEHVPALCCVICSLYFLVRYFRLKRSGATLCLSAAMLSVGVFFRSEVILLTIPYTGCLCLTLCAQKQVKKAVMVVICSATPIVCCALFNYRFYGTALGLHVLYNAPGFSFSKRMAALPLGTLVLSFVLAFLTKKSRVAPALKQHLYAFVPLLFIPFMLLFSAFSPVSSLFFAFPLVLLFFLTISDRIEKLLSGSMSLGDILFGATTGFIFLVSYFLAKNPDMSVRYCLPVIPLTIIFIAHEQGRILPARPMVTLVLALFVFSAGYEAYILKNDIWNYKQYNAERIEFLKTATKPGDIIMVDSQPLMEHSGPLFFERILIVAQNPHELSLYVRLLKEKGVVRSYWWAHSGSLPKDTSYEASGPAVFSSRRGVKNYLFTLSANL